MRALGFVSLLLALIIVGLLAKKQLGAVAAVPAVPAVPARGQGAVSSPGATPAQKSQQLQQQIKQSVESSMQPRTVPDENN